MPLHPRKITSASCLWGHEKRTEVNHLMKKNYFLCALEERIELKFRV